MKRALVVLLTGSALLLSGCAVTTLDNAQTVAASVSIERGARKVNPTPNLPGLSPAPSATTSTPAVSPTAEGTTANSALAVLNTLEVKGRAPKTGYDREGKFGVAWTDSNTVEFGGNKCDTRNDILARDLTQIVKDGKCTVTSGVLADKYTGTTINFVRGQKTSSAVQIDHVVALSDSWQKGSQLLTQAQRINLANDPRNLLAADGPANSAKGDKDAATWLPPNKSFRCEYVARQVGVKKIYKLWVTQAEKEAIAGVLAGCKGQQIPFAL